MPALPAAIEARGLLGLLKNGETIQSIRALIGEDGEYRKSVRLHFDVLVARLRRHGKGLRRNVNSRAISERLRNEISRLLRLGWSRERVRATLNVGPWVISRIAREIHACYFKRGRGRRFTAEMEERIRAAVRTGTPSAEIERAFGVGYDTVLKFRHEMGNYQNLRLRRKLSASQIGEATQRLKSGQHWRAVAAAFRVSVKTLATAVPYRKREDRIKLSPAQAAEAVELLKSGETWLRVAQGFGMARSTLQLRLGYWKRKTYAAQDAATKKAKQSPGGDRKSEEYKIIVDNINVDSRPTGTSTAQALRRLRKDSPRPAKWYVALLAL